MLEPTSAGADQVGLDGHAPIAPSRTAGARSCVHGPSPRPCHSTTRAGGTQAGAHAERDFQV